MPRHRLVCLAALIVIATSAFARAADADGFADTFGIPADALATTGRNDWFSLEPGYQLLLEGPDKDGKSARLLITVLDQTKKVDGVNTRVVEHRQTTDGATKTSRDYFAIDSRNDIYHFGRDGAWTSGKNDAHHALMMCAQPRVGMKHYQALAPKVAMDRAEVLSLNERMATPAGEFENCLKTLETTPLSPDAKETKIYAKGVGLVAVGNLKLIKYGKNIEPRKSPKQPGGGQQANQSGKKHTPADADVIIPVPIAFEALGAVGSDPIADALWNTAINDPNVSEHDRQDLIEDLNESGFADRKNLTPEDLPLIVNRLALIEQLAPDAMDQTNADAFAEAYKDLTKMYRKAGGE